MVSLKELAAGSFFANKLIERNVKTAVVGDRCRSSQCNHFAVGSKVSIIWSPHFGFMAQTVWGSVGRGFRCGKEASIECRQYRQLMSSRSPLDRIFTGAVKCLRQHLGERSKCGGGYARDWWWFSDTSKCEDYKWWLVYLQTSVRWIVWKGVEVSNWEVESLFVSLRSVATRYAHDDCASIAYALRQTVKTSTLESITCLIGGRDGFENAGRSTSKSSNWRPGLSYCWMEMPNLKACDWRALHNNVPFEESLTRPLGLLPHLSP